MSSFQKRHYEAIAQIMQRIQHAVDSNEIGGAMATHFAVIALADMLAKDNPHFDRARFEAACVPGANVKQRGRKLAQAVYAKTLKEISQVTDR